MIRKQTLDTAKKEQKSSSNEGSQDKTQKAFVDSPLLKHKNQLQEEQKMEYQPQVTLFSQIKGEKVQGGSQYYQRGQNFRKLAASVQSCRKSTGLNNQITLEQDDEVTEMFAGESGDSSPNNLMQQTIKEETCEEGLNNSMARESSKSNFSFKPKYYKHAENFSQNISSFVSQN